jgi:tetratricopeptide (TPR) repeat protein
LDPSSADAAYNLGLVYHDSGDERRAIELYKQCLRTSQERIDAWMNLASCFHAIGDMDKSIFAYNKVLEEDEFDWGGDDDDEVKSKVHEYLGRERY